jgi:glucose/arabinose dehydrogenase
LRRLPLVVATAVAIGLGAGALVRAWVLRVSAPAGIPVGLSLRDLGDDVLVEVATGLDTPWEIAFLPGGGVLVTERGGRLVRLGADGERVASWDVPGVREQGEGGLLGLALDPAFPDTRFAYVYLTTEDDNRVVRYRLSPEDGLQEPTVVLDGIPRSGFHNGGRIEFGPDGRLWVTTGDGGDSSRAQEADGLGGKILRVSADGSVPEDNPGESVVWSTGHRNPQGLAWDGDGALWSTEHGRSGIGSGMDELNRVVRGGNHGWPVIEGDEGGAGMVTPVAHSGPDVTWAPSDVEWARGRLFFGALRGEALYEARPREGGRADLVVHFFGELGRVRAVRLGPDGWLYLATSNRDGRGTVRPGDDRVVKIDPAVFDRNPTQGRTP